jgi:hypothetical protein
MSVGTDVPYWVGADGNDHVIRLLVPRWLGTKTFKLSASHIAEAVQLGRDQTKTQLESILAGLSA